MDKRKQVVIVGASHAGISLSAGIRKRSAEVAITLISDEGTLPYQRPPLSKKYLLGELPAERLLLRPESWYTEQNITLKKGVSIDRIERTAKCVYATGGEKFSYDNLVFATGCRARQLPEEMHHGAENIVSVRTLADVHLLQGLMEQAKRVLIVGGGYIGLEAAAVMRKFGLEVTLIEAAPRILGRVASTETADYFRALHEQHGTRIIEGVTLKDFTFDGTKISAALLADGSEIATDLVIVGIGILPNTKLAEQAGLTVDRGIVVDAFGRTSDPDIYAAGDVAIFPYGGSAIRLESVQNANDQADLVAENILGDHRAYQPVPWFWSDQYDVSLQIIGLNTNYDQVLARDGKKPGAKSHWYLRAGKVIAVDAMNDAPSYAAVKKILENGGSITEAQVRDPNSTPKDWLKTSL